MGAYQPRWRGDGKELFFLTRDEKLVAVPVRWGDTGDFEVGVAQVLFETRLDIAGSTDYARHYDVAADGQRFLLATQVGDSGTTPFAVITNWPSLLQR